jgi:hypothetical protein
MVQIQIGESSQMFKPTKIKITAENIVCWTFAMSETTSQQVGWFEILGHQFPIEKHTFVAWDDTYPMAMQRSNWKITILKTRNHRTKSAMVSVCTKLPEGRSPWHSPYIPIISSLYYIPIGSKKNMVVQSSHHASDQPLPRLTAPKPLT